MVQTIAIDIVKAHGEEWKVETEDARPDNPAGRGEDIDFIIHLPAINY